MSHTLPGLRLKSVRSIDSIAALPSGPRKIYRYSVVPGGVYSTAEFERARRMDPVVAAHYAEFGPKVSLTKLTKDMYVYVSYRKAIMSTGAPRSIRCAKARRW